jgi:thiol:disulfide interchange protein DsbD
MRLLFLALTFLAAPALAQLSKAPAPTLPGSVTFLPVEEAYAPAIEREEDGDLRLYWQIAEGYYLYRHHFDFALRDDSGPVALDAELPPALERTDEYFGDVAVYYDSADITLIPARPLQGDALLTVSSQGCADAGLCYPPREQRFAIDGSTGAVRELPAAAAGAAPVPARASGTGRLLTMLLLAASGGLILNLMPCVFPVLSLKAVSFAAAEPSERHRHAWLYAAGVVVSFLAIAALLLVLRGAGMAVGWGFQLQSPAFVTGLAYLFVAMGLGLSGVIHFGGRIAGIGDGLASAGGARGSFFTGALAVLVASPCTAPFMGTALGFALTQPPAISLAVFAALGAGMAAPIVLLGHSVLARRLLPRPGPWMKRLQQTLAFPLYATALWLFWVLGRQGGVDAMAVALAGALCLAFGLWLWASGGWRRVPALLVLIAALSLGARPGDGEAPGQAAAGGGQVAWSEAAVREARAAGRPVFVDFTADWCLTCLANERAVLGTETVAEAFAEHGVVYMVADWTNRDPAIAGFLTRMGRSGVPLYLLYPGRPGAAPAVLPQLLRKRDVLAALDALDPS